MSNSIKIKTGITGLDILLKWDNGGVNPFVNGRESLLIVIRGKRGISKVNLAMEIMQGINSCFPDVSKARFYSLDKNHKALTNKYNGILGLEGETNSLFPVLKPQKEASYLFTKMLQFNAIVEDLNELENDCLNCVVIDGFAGLGEKDYARLPMEAIEELLRKKACVSILVFDDRLTNYQTSADIIIEMRKSVNEQHNYTFFELQIAKDFLKTATSGWHKYRCTERGEIIVYPSVHRILTLSQASGGPDDGGKGGRTVIKAPSIPDLFSRVINTDGNYAYPDFVDNRKKSLEAKDLKDVLSLKSGTVTSIIGASNTFKRRLAAMSVIDALKANKRVLVIFLNDARRGFMDILSNLDPDYLSHEKLHLFEMPMGCLFPEEFINMLGEYVKKFKEQEKEDIGIYLIDLVALDYAFPMLQAETLFLPALASFCKRKKKEVGLTVVCNKKFSQVDELCFVSDAVLVTERENGNSAGSLNIYLEKNPFGQEQNSRVFKFKVDDISTLCFENLNGVSMEETCTTKDFWRQAWNVKSHTNPNAVQDGQDE